MYHFDGQLFSDHEKSIFSIWPCKQLVVGHWYDWHTDWLVDSSNLGESSDHSFDHLALDWIQYDFFLSGMQNIDSEIYEAASIDGASKWQQFIKVTIPNLKPIILFTSITSTIGTLQLFDEVQNITGGDQQMQRPPYLNTSIIWVINSRLILDMRQQFPLLLFPLLWYCR